jgi:hypothetical protein
LRRFDEEKHRVIGEEIHKLLEAGFINEVHHPEWLANHVLVKKKSGKWRMCVDYTSLNKACPKVPFPLPHIDQIVDSTVGCETLSFLDAYSSYHQIKNERVRPARDFIHYPIQHVLLGYDAFRSPERSGYVPVMHATCFWETHRVNRRGLR